MGALKLRLVGLHGFRGCGKDTISEHLVKTYDNCIRISLGDMLRDELNQVFNIPYDSLFDRSKDYEYSDVTWAYFNERIRKLYNRPSKEFLTYRQLMQIYATDFRRYEDQDYWLNKWRDRVNLTPEDKCIVTPDVRFHNEAKMFMEHGLLIRINDGLPREAPPHPSDALLPMRHNDVDGKGLQDVHTMCQQAVDACKVQEFVKNDNIKELKLYA
jgi:hypothetical protein